MNKKQLTAFGLALGIGATCFAGCSGGSNKSDSNKEVSLKWLIPSLAEQKDGPMVYEAFNKKLKEFPGMEKVTVDINTISAGEYSQKFMLLQTSGDLPDIAGTYTLNYVSEVQNDTFIPLSELVEKNAPDITKEIPDWVFDLVRVKGEYYVIPNYQMMPIGTLNLTTLTEDAKYWDTQKMQDIMWKNDYFTKECYDEIETYLANLKANGALDKGVYLSSMIPRKGYESLNVGAYYVKTTEDKPKVVNIWETPEMKLLFDVSRDWFEKGYVRKDILSADINEDVGKTDGMDLWTVQAIKGTKESLSASYKNDATLIPTQEKFVTPNSSAAGGNGILEECENPETAVKFLELMYTEKGKDLYNMLVYGIEGTHYKKVSDDRIEVFDYSIEPDSNSSYGIRKWVAGNTANAYETVGNFEGYKDYVFNDLNPNSVKSRFAGCVFDTTNFESKLLQVNAVYSEYDKPLCSGALPNYEATYKEFMGKLKSAGNDDIKADLQKQVDEWFKNKK